jgi:TIR domain
MKQWVKRRLASDPIFFFEPPHRRRVLVLDLEPMRRSASASAAIASRGVSCGSGAGPLSQLALCVCCYLSRPNSSYTITVLRVEGAHGVTAVAARPHVRVQTKAKIFISYSRKDLAFVDQLEAALKARGFEPLIDRTEIYAFEDWWKRIEGLIGNADTVIFTLSPESVGSEICAKEVAYAASLNKRFAPIICRRVDDGGVPEPLRRLNFVFFEDPAQFQVSLDKLVEALKTDIGWIRQHTAYGEAAHLWSAAGRPGGLLLRSPALEEAERWIASRPADAPPPTDATQAFIADG